MSEVCRLDASMGYINTQILPQEMNRNLENVNVKGVMPVRDQ
jgi:hypothetical protein